MALDLRSNDDRVHHLTEQHTWDSAIHVSMPVSEAMDLLTNQLDLINGSLTSPMTNDMTMHDPTDYTVLTFDGAEGWDRWCQKIGDALKDETNNQKNMLVYEFKRAEASADPVPLFLLAVNTILRACVMGHAVCVRLDAVHAGVPGTRGSLRTHLGHLLRACTENINTYEINQMYQVNLVEIV